MITSAVILIFLSVISILSGAPLRVSSLGFSPQDSTDYLQQALDSQASEILIDRQASPWRTGPLFCRRNNLTIILEPGVKIQAVRGAFRGRYDSMLTIDSQENITITGNGAELSMDRESYQNPSLYQRSEWRHLLNLLSARNITVSNLAIGNSGGDGIYVGVSRKKGSLPYCKNIVLRQITCRNHHRQGISVISADNLLIESCSFTGTQGTSPEDGIDFEPNSARQRLHGCVIRNCSFSDNAGDAVGTFLRLSHEALPVDILFENCQINGTFHAGIAAGRYSVREAVSGMIMFRNCHFKGPGTLFRLDNYRSDSCRIRLEDCHITRTGDTGKPLLLLVDTADNKFPVGNIHYQNCRVSGSTPLPLDYIPSYGPDNHVTSVTGTLTLHNRTVDLAEEVKKRRFDRVDFTPASKTDWRTLIFQASGKMSPSPKIRGPIAFILRVSQPGLVRFTLHFRHPVKNSTLRRKLSLKLMGANGDRIPLAHAMQTVSHYEFHAPESGNYRLECNPNGLYVCLHDCDVPFLMLPIENSFAHLYKPKGKLYFRAFPDTEITALISGEMEEHVTARLLEHGKTLDSVTKTSSVSRLSGRSQDGCPAVDIIDCIEDVKFRLPAPALPFFTNTPGMHISLP